MSNRNGKGKYDPSPGNVKGFGTFDPTASGFRTNRAGTAFAPGTFIEPAPSGNTMDINLDFVNNTLSDLTFEAFNFIDSFVNYIKSQFATGNYLYVPQTSKEGIERIAANTDGTVGFDQNGDLVIRGGNADPVATLSCKEINYQGLFQASGQTPFTVGYMRYKASNQDQIKQNIVYFQRTMGGSESTNTINPRSYQLPSNEIDTLIDIPKGFVIGYNSGLRMKVLAGQSVQLTLFITSWTAQAQN